MSGVSCRPADGAPGELRAADYSSNGTRCAELEWNGMECHPPRRTSSCRRACRCSCARRGGPAGRPPPRAARAARWSSWSTSSRRSPRRARNERRRAVSYGDHRPSLHTARRGARATSDGVPSHTESIAPLFTPRRNGRASSSRRSPRRGGAGRSGAPRTDRPSLYSNHEREVTKEVTVAGPLADASPSSPACP